MEPKRKKRGAVTKEGSQLVAVWLPNELCKRLDEMVRRLDTDRSKLIRKAIRQAAA
jgi:metal-responsive CopG/Arc/MetJ family transcriptional regulator